MATEQALREQNQLLRKQLEEMNMQMQALMAQGSILATLGDQDAGQRGMFVDFLGRPASTHKVMAATRSFSWP